MTDREIDGHTGLASAAGLEGAEMLLDRERIRRCCNGIGAAWMPEIARKILNAYAPELVVASFIHDIEYELGGTEYDRIAADDRMFRNGLKIANHLYGWYHPKRYRVRRRALQLRAALALGGRSAFNYVEEKGNG